MQSIEKKLTSLISKLEGEMKVIGCWNYENTASPNAAFGGETMSFEGWLECVFIPNVKEAISKKKYPSDASHIGVAAIRNFDGQPKFQKITDLLFDIDSLLNKFNHIK